jgi:ABC-type Fe3+ transport system substrate-binding protein
MDEAAFAKAEPSIEIKWIRDSTGVITSKLIAEKNNPQVDVWAAKNCDRILEEWNKRYKEKAEKS